MNMMSDFATEAMFAGLAHLEREMWCPFCHPGGMGGLCDRHYRESEAARDMFVEED